jgi:hypothetical protein
MTPAVIRLRRGVAGCALTFTKEGFAEEKVALRRARNGKFWANFGVGGGTAGIVGVLAAVALMSHRGAEETIGNAIGAGFFIGTAAGMITDASNGAMYDYVPDSVSVKLKPSR